MKEKFLNGVKKFFVSREFWGYIVAVAVMAVVSIAFFHPDAFEGNSLRQGDMLQGAANGQEIKTFREETGEQSRWTNSLFGGMPTFQISPSYPSDGMFRWIDTAMRAGLPEPSGYLFSMMMGFLIMCACLRLRWYYALIGALAWGLSSYFVIIIGAGHLWKFFTLTYVPPVIGGVVMAYRGKILAGTAVAALFAMMQIAANHVQMTYYFLILILVLAFAYLVTAIGKGTLKRWFRATSCLVGGAFLAIVANSPSLYNTYAYSKETIRGQHSLLGSSVGESKATGLDKDYILQYSYGRAESFTLLIPNVKGGASGKPVNGRMTALTLAQLPQAEELREKGRLDNNEMAYLEYNTRQYFGEPESTNGPVYVGAIICCLFLLGCFIVRGPLKWTLLSLTVLSLLLAMGRNCMWLSDFFIDYVPMYKNFRTPESILVIAEFTMPLLGVLGLAKFLSESRPLQTYRWQLTVAFGIPLVICFFGWVFPGVFGSTVTQSDFESSAWFGHMLQAQGYGPAEVSYLSIDNPAIYSAVDTLRSGMVSADSFRSLIFILIGFAVLWLAARKIMPRWLAVAAIGAFILGDLYSADKRYLSHESFVPGPVETESQFPMSDTDRAILNDTSMNYRVMDIPRFWQPDPSFYHKAIGGYHAAKLTRYQDLIDRHLGNFASGSVSEADWNVLDMLNARYVIDGQNQVSYNPHALGNAWFVENIKWVSSPDAEMEALSYIDPATTAVIDKSFEADVKVAEYTKIQGDTIFETSYAPNRLTYHASVSKPALAVFSEIYFPWGWIATLDGKEVPIVRADYVLRALTVPAGEHTIEMRFEPKSVAVTVTWARVSIIMVYILVALAMAMGFTAFGADSKAEGPDSTKPTKKEPQR